MSLKRWTVIPFWVCAATLANLAAAAYVRQQHVVYFWDSANYWLKFIRVTQHFGTSPLEAAVSIGQSLRTAEYNDLGAVPMVPFGLLFGTGRLAFVLAIVNVYLLPAALALTYACRRIVARVEGTEESSFRAALVASIVMLLSPQVWAPVLLGLVDVGGLILVFLSIGLVFGKQKEGDTLKAAAVGLSMAVLVLFRRWYAFWVITWIGVLSVELILRLVVDRERRQAVARSGIRFLLIAGVVSAGTYLLASGSEGLQRLRGDYAFAYAAYRFGLSQGQSILEEARRVWHDSGPLFCVSVLASVAYLLALSRYRRIAILLGLQSVGGAVLFARQQLFGSHHWYLVAPFLLLSIALATLSLLRLLKPAARVVFAAGFIVAWLANGAVVYIERAAPIVGPFAAVLTPIRSYPEVRNDLPEIERLLNHLDALLSDPKDRLYVLASSSVINADLLHHAYLTLHRAPKCERQIYASHEIDKRDGLPRAMFESRFLLVARPVQTIVRPEDQLVIGVPATFVLNGDGIGRSFRRLPEIFHLDGGVQVELYKKVRPFDRRAVERLISIWQRAYAAWPHLFRCRIRDLLRLSEHGAPAGSSPTTEGLERSRS